MTTEQLLIPRRKVAIKYPDSPYEIGQILICNNGTKYYDEFPGIFKEIFWWEERKEEDMPEYVKNKNGQTYIRKVLSYTLPLESCLLDYDGTTPIPLKYFLPATQSEYKTQNKK